MDEFQIQSEIESLAADYGMHPKDDYERLLDMLWEEKGCPECTECAVSGWNKDRTTCAACHGSGAAF